MADTQSVPDKPLVSVIILNYNGLSFLPNCLETLRRTSYPRVELNVVDNCSTDGSLAYLRTHHPDIKSFAMQRNLGYSGAYNAVIPKVGGEVIVLLNFDVEVEADWLDQALEVMIADPNVAACQPKLRALQKRGTFEYSGGSGGFIDRYGYPVVRGRVFGTIEEDQGQYDDIASIHWASGAACIVRREAYETAGGLDDDFFLHMEELDLCWRFWLLGYTVKVAPAGVVYHYAGAALSADRFHKMYYNHRNGLVMMLKNYSTWNLLRYLPVRWCLDWMTILTAPLRKEPKRALAVLAAHGYILFHLLRIMSKRFQVQAARRRMDSELSDVILPFSVVRKYYLNKHRTFSQLLSGR